MKSIELLKSRPRSGLGLAAAALAYLVSIACATAAGSSAPDTNAPPAKAASPPIRKLDGAQLYAINCNRCHPERYPTEFNSAQWKTLMMHMRVRANLPAKQARAVLKYLQEESGN